MVSVGCGSTKPTSLTATKVNQAAEALGLSCPIVANPNAWTKQEAAIPPVAPYVSHVTSTSVCENSDIVIAAMTFSPGVEVATLATLGDSPHHPRGYYPMEDVYGTDWIVNFFSVDLPKSVAFSHSLRSVAAALGGTEGVLPEGKTCGGWDTHNVACHTLY
jgi:hypothetical protein